MKTLLFILHAVRSGHAYIDMDGCLLRRMPVPAWVPPEEALDWWIANLTPTPIVKRRLALLYLLRFCRVRLYIWTNRGGRHHPVTALALGWHLWLFEDWLYMDGQKHRIPRRGPCMDDQAKYVCERGDLLVKQL